MSAAAGQVHHRERGRPHVPGSEVVADPAPLLLRQARHSARAAVLAVARSWAQQVIDEIGRGRDPDALVGSANVLATILSIASEYEAEEDAAHLKVLNAIVAADKTAPNAVYELASECEAVTVDVDEVVNAVEDGFLDD